MASDAFSVKVLGPFLTCSLLFIFGFEGIASISSQGEHDQRARGLFSYTVSYLFLGADVGGIFLRRQGMREMRVSRIRFVLGVFSTLSVGCKISFSLFSVSVFLAHRVRTVTEYLH